MRTLLEHAGFLACNLDQTSTGVQGAVIWIFSGEPTLIESALGPRILVTLGDLLLIEGLTNAVAVRLSRPPEVVEALPATVKRQAVAFAAANRVLLQKYWVGRMSTQALLGLLERI